MFRAIMAQIAVLPTPQKYTYVSEQTCAFEV